MIMQEQSEIMDVPPDKQPKRSRLAIPIRLKSNVDYIDDALKCLRLSETIDWSWAKHGERTFQPYFDQFEPNTQKTIDRLAKLYEVSRSKIVSTALQLQRQAPGIGAKPSGFRASKKGARK